MTWPQMDNRDALVTSCLLTFAEIMLSGGLWHACMYCVHGICCTCCHELHFLSVSGRYH